MFTVIRQRLSSAHALAFAALLVALGGTSYAAFKPAPNSVGAPQLRAGAVTAAKVRAGAITTAKVRSGAITTTRVRNGSLLAKDFKSGQLPAGPKGPQGAPGPQGPAGAPGSALAFARVTESGDVVGPNSKGITNAQVDKSQNVTAAYCIRDLGFAPTHAVATPEAGTGVYGVTVGYGPGSACPAGTQFHVRTFDAAGKNTDGPFLLLVN